MLNSLRTNELSGLLSCLTSRERAELNALLKLTPRTSLVDFARYTFPAYRPAKHHYQIAGALERVERGECRRLMIFVPPRHGKSELASIRFPAWYLGRDPQRQVIGCSYAADLAYTFSRAVRGTITGERYQAVFPKRELDAGSAAVAKWTLAGKENKRASYIAAGVGGPITGEGADLLIIDDPVKNAQEAESETYRQNVWEWYTTTARTRLQPGGSIVLIMTRWHQDDLAGRLLDQAKADPKADQWKVIHLSAINDAGKALWPAMYDLTVLEAIRASIGSRAFEALYQGNPTPPEGAMFKRGWFSQIIDREPAKLRSKVRYWDLAATRGGDYTVGALVGIGEDEVLYILDVARVRAEWPEARRAIMATALMDEVSTVQGIEVVGMQRGLYDDITALPGSAQRKFVKSPIHAGDKKEVRAAPWAARAEDGKVVLRRGDWNAAFVAECCDFPYGQHDDQVDAVSGAVAMASQATRGWTAYATRG